MRTGRGGPADGIIPRFLACGGRKSRLHFVAGVREEHAYYRLFDPALTWKS